MELFCSRNTSTEKDFSHLDKKDAEQTAMRISQITKYYKVILHIDNTWQEYENGTLVAWSA